MISRTIRYTVLILIPLTVPIACHSQSDQAPCKQIEESTRLKVAAYVMGKYNVTSQASLTLTSIERVATSCFEAFTYSVAGRASPLTVYLDPGQSYLVPSLWDLSSDPKREERARRQQMQEAMIQGNLHQTGSENATVTIVEFTDFQCPFCRKEAESLQALKPDFPKSGVRLIYRNFPLPMHRWALDAARMATCASKQDEKLFWLTHDFFFSNQAKLTNGNLEEQVSSFLSTKATFDRTKLDSCVAQHQTDNEIQSDQALGKVNGVVGTPTLFINGVLVRGAKSTEDLQGLIEAAKQGKQMGIKRTETAVNSKE